MPSAIPRVRCFRAASTCLLLAAVLLTRPVALGSEPPWNEIHGRYFSLITDAGEKQGREAALRLEQMRNVFGGLLMKNRLHMPVPLTVIALKNGQEYTAIAPSDQKRSNASGFLVDSDDHNYIVLNLAAAEPWRAVAYDFARVLLSYNYPSTQPWFDEGLAQYFSSIWVDDKQVEIGGDPGLNSARSFTEVLKTSAWIPIADLFTTKRDKTGTHEDARSRLFSAGSWIVMHYILNQQKLPEAGTYFDLVQNQKMPVDQAVTKAFGMPAAQFEQAVKDYFHSLGAPTTVRESGSRPTSNSPPAQPHQFPSPIGPGDLGATVTPFPEPDGHALLADVMVRLPEHREDGVKQLQELAADPVNNETAHRMLAAEKIQRNEFDSAAQELGAAADLNPRDVWIRYYLSLLKYRIAQSTGQPIQGLANMMQDLRAVLDWYPDFAEAYNMLAMARVEGGGMNSALEAIRAAIQLSPRNGQYLYNLGVVYVSWKKWEPARAIFERVEAGGDARLAAAADNQLKEMQARQKYGITAQAPAGPATQTKPSTTRQASVASEKSPPPESESSEAADVNEAEKKSDTQVATGPIQFLKGKLLTVDCSQPPGAMLTILANGKTFKLHTPDYKSLTVIGADTFSCDWTNRQVSINYRASGKTGGDLVSLEVR